MSTSIDAHVRTLPPRATLFGNDATTAAADACLPDWTGALCGDPDVDPDLWFPEGRDSAEPAKSICRDCPLRAQCLDWALATREPYGVWGGADERERRKLLTRLSDARTPGEHLEPVTPMQHGDLQAAVAAQVDAFPSQVFTVVDLARTLGRPRQSVANALAALERLGTVRQLERRPRRPRRYVSTAVRPRTPVLSARAMLRAQIRAHMRAHPGQAFTVNEVTRAIKADRESVYFALKTLTRHGELVRLDRPAPGRSHQHRFTLAHARPETVADVDQEATQCAS